MKRKKIIIILNAIFFILILLLVSSSYGIPISYTYDNLNRLTSANYGSYTEQYTYDAAGNRLTLTTTALHTITVPVVPNGNIIPSGTIMVSNNADQQFTITSNTGYHISDVKLDNVSVWSSLVFSPSATSPYFSAMYTLHDVTSDHTISVAFSIDTLTVTVVAAGDGSGSVTSSVGGINYTYPTTNTETSAPINYGSPITIIAITDTGTIVSASNCAAAGGIIGGTQTNATCSITSLTASEIITSTFSLAQKLTVSKTGTGTGNVSVDSGSLLWSGLTGYTYYPLNTQVNLSADADSDSAFIGWAGACNGNASPCSLQMSADQSVTAKFNSKTDFSGTPITGAVPLTVSFSDASINSPTLWSWDFGDGSTSTLQNPMHTYKNVGTGSYTVSLTATGTGGAVTMTKSAYITVEPCSALGTVKIGGTNYYYTSIQNACTALTNGESLQLQALDFTENPDLNQNISVSLSGGYSCDYSSNPGFTTIHGTLTISDGKVTISQIIIQ